MNIKKSTSCFNREIDAQNIGEFFLSSFAVVRENGFQLSGSSMSSS